MSVVIKGAYGLGNLGDEAILVSMLESLSGDFPDANAVVLSANPEWTRSRYGVHSTLGSLPRNLLGVLSAFRRGSVFVLGGGGLFPSESPRNLLPNLTYLALAKALGMKVLVYSVGVDPLRNRLARLLVRLVIGLCADDVSVRDQTSLEALRDAGLRCEIRVASDPATALRGSDLVPEIDAPRGGYLTGALVMPWNVKVERSARKRHPVYVRGWASVLDCLLEKAQLSLFLIPFKVPEDADLHDQVVAEMRFKDRVTVLRELCDPSAAKSLIAGSEMLVGMRFHSFVFALSSGTPVAGISYAPKSEALVKRYNLDRYLVRLGIRASDYYKQEHDVDFAALRERVLEAWEQRTQIRSAISRVNADPTGGTYPLAIALKTVGFGKGTLAAGWRG